MFMPEANDVPELVDDDAKLIAVVADRNRLRTVAPFPDERATTARPDLMKRSKAGYRVTLVACRWAGAVIEKDNGALGRSSELKTLKNAEKVEGTEQTINRPTDGQSGGIDSRSTRLRSKPQMAKRIAKSVRISS